MPVPETDLQTYALFFNAGSQGLTNLGYFRLPIIEDHAFFIWRAWLHPLGDNRFMFASISPQHRDIRDISIANLLANTYERPGGGDIKEVEPWVLLGGMGSGPAGHDVYFNYEKFICGPQECRTRIELSGGTGTTGEHLVGLDGKWKEIDHLTWLKHANDRVTKIFRDPVGVNVNIPLLH